MNKIRIITGTVFGALALAGAIACGGGGDDTVPPYATIDPSITVTATTGDPDPTPTTPTAEPKKATEKPISAEQANATESARSYLEHQSFSRKGLIEQLAYEGYGKKAATAAVDSLHVDWNAQAEQTAAGYLEHQSFSRKGLIEQLEYEGYTAAQARHGVSKTGL